MKYVRTSPRKMRRVIDMIRGQHVVEARRILRFSPLGADARGREAAELGDRQRRAAARRDRGQPDGVARLGRRRPDAAPVPAARVRPRHAGAQAHVARDARGGDDGRGSLVGHKVNPYGFRLGVIYPWKSNWYAGRREYAGQLHEDIWIRKHIRSRLSRAGISSIDIERKGDQIWVFIRTARPGIVIGRKGAEVDRLRKDIERYTKKRVDVKVEDMNQAASESRPETDATLLAQGVAEQLAGSRGVPPRDAPRRADGDALGRPRRARGDRRPTRRLGDGPARVVPRGPRAPAHPARQGRLRHGRGQDHVRHHRREGLGLPRRRGAPSRAADRAGARTRARIGPAGRDRRTRRLDARRGPGAGGPAPAEAAAPTEAEAPAAPVESEPLPWPSPPRRRPPRRAAPSEGGDA